MFYLPKINYNISNNNKLVNKLFLSKINIFHIYIPNNHVIHRFFNVTGIGTNSAREGTMRRLINSRRGVVSADLIRAWAQGGCWKPFPLLSDVRRVGLAPQGSLVPRAASQGRAKNHFLPLSLSLSARLLFPHPPRSRFTSFCFRVRGYVAATLFSGEIPRSAIYIFDVASVHSANASR